MSNTFWSWMGCSFACLMSGKTTSHELPFWGKYGCVQKALHKDDDQLHGCRSWRVMCIETRCEERLWPVRTLKRLVSNIKQCINELYDLHDSGDLVQQAAFLHLLSSAFLNTSSSRKGLCWCLGSTWSLWEATVAQIPLKIKVETGPEWRK